MLEKNIKKCEIFSNLISLSNLLETEIRGLSKELSISHFEVSMLMHISKEKTTQYRIAKKYSTSIQRVHQITKKFKKRGYVTISEELDKGRLLKKMSISTDIERSLNQINNVIGEKLGAKKITSRNLTALDSILKIVLEKLNTKTE